MDPAPAEHCHLQVFNLAPGDVSVAIRGSDLFAHPIPSLQVAAAPSCFNTHTHTHTFRPGRRGEGSAPLRQDPPEYQVVGLKASSRKLQIEATFQGRTSACEPLVQERKAYSLLLVPEGEDLRCKLVRRRDGGRLDECRRV